MRDALPTNEATPATRRRGFRDAVRSAVLMALALAVAAGTASASDPRVETPVPAAATVEPPWPGPGRFEELGAIGRGAGVVFSPDISAPGNRLFYERLGFAYFEDASWDRILRQIEWRNAALPDRRIETLIVTSHGANGNGLKLQASKARGAARSYASIGGIQERLERAGVRVVLIAACNPGRLFRPGIYRRLDTRVRDPLFLPPTLGVVNSSARFDPSRSRVTVLRRVDSLKENTTEGYVADLSPGVRRALGLDAMAARLAMKPDQLRFVVPDLLLQLAMRDPSLKLTGSGYAVKVSSDGKTNEESERLYHRFIDMLDGLAPRDTAVVRR